MKNIDAERIHCLQESDVPAAGEYVLYWMSHSFRTNWNYALEYALGMAEEHAASVLVLISLSPEQTYRNDRQLRLLLQGMPELADQLEGRRIKLLLRVEEPAESIASLAPAALAVITDFPYLDRQRQELRQVQKAIDLPLYALEGNVVVPVAAASDKQEYAARTIRPKLQEKYAAFLTKPRSSEVPKSSLELEAASEDAQRAPELFSQFSFPETSAALEETDLVGGESAAKDHLDSFLHHQLERYQDQRQSPTDPAVSYLSVYLAAGMLAPAYILRRLEPYEEESVADFREELLVRRELAINFVHYAETYDQINALPDWAQTTLEDHKEDERAHSYTRAEFEAAETHDEAWNACMRRMKTYGYLHNHLRMYWGKQILAWSNTPYYAHQTLLYLNNKYFLDGYTPNSYANTLWVFGLHDRAWQENEVFGKVRLMNRNGLNRKVDIATLIDEV